MLLSNINIIQQEGRATISVKGGKISQITDQASSVSRDVMEHCIFFEDAIAFPGLINSHDHLDFNLFPQLGHTIYNNYAEWGERIHREHKEQINNIIKIPLSLRVQWGIYKNLLAGITTVVNHGDKIPEDNSLINVFQQCQVIHSVKGDKNWRSQLNKLYKKGPVVIHTGEGTDRSAQAEIDRLINWNLFKRKLVGIHGVAMKEDQASSFKALVWCPGSNYFMFGKTAAIDSLQQKTTILFGTDSALTASWNIWDHLRLARSKNLVTDEELFNMLNLNPATIWNMKETGQLAENQWADMVVAKAVKGVKKWDAFYSLNPEDILLVLHRGNVRLFDDELSHQLKDVIDINDFSKIYISGVGKYVQGNIGGLMNEIRRYNASIDFPAHQ